MAFLNELHTVYVGPRRWALTRPLSYASRRYGTIITAPAGFIMDYSSVPRVPIVFALLGDTGHKAAAIHDYLYAEGHGRWTRKQADLIFYDALLEHEPRWRARMMYAGVRVGGWVAWRKHKARFYA